MVRSSAFPVEHGKVRRGRSTRARACDATLRNEATVRPSRQGGGSSLHSGVVSVSHAWSSIPTVCWRRHYLLPLIVAATIVMKSNRKANEKPAT